MTKLFFASVAGLFLIAFIPGCSRALPAGPTEAGGTPPAAAADLASTTPVVTLQSDNTASPSSVGVSAGATVLFTNNSGHYVLLRSYNCTEFSSMGLAAGASRHTMPFNPAGKTCDYFAYVNSQKAFVGRVLVQ